MADLPTNPSFQEMTIQSLHGKQEDVDGPIGTIYDKDDAIRKLQKELEETKSMLQDAQLSHLTETSYGSIDARPRKPMWLQILEWFHSRLFSGYFQITPEDDLLRVIDIEIIVDGHQVRRTAIALIDTGCPKNLMRQSLAAKFGVTFSSAGGNNLILETIGNGSFESVGEVVGRWASKKDPRKSRLGFDPKYYDATWHVSDMMERWDVIIGLETISKHGLLMVKRELAAPAAFRRAPRQLDPVATKDALAKQEEAIQKNTARREQHEAQQAKLEATPAQRS
ncbi:hypothetical protein K505DRAFT_413437 [Melanomma pulvis-pyrius CBS 109.77]|uniref:Uncharacterized protein n=1 Tax=Melanomma pulvis-pyrius CBS 109.77 TaxID=1314802 RepID=A0A6A6XTR0_9PLEO|nr:hypothetical protein K505DRAFT_413437 [Melanomma pulvis-pyrius CBS 109.77]